MRAKIKFKTGLDVVKAGFKLPQGMFEDTILRYDVGQEFYVIGMAIIEEHLCFLIDDEFVEFQPAFLFDVIDDQLNSTWHFTLLSDSHELYPYYKSIWGYSELCHDTSHLMGLIEENEEDVQLYFQRKLESQSHTKQV